MRPRPAKAAGAALAGLVLAALSHAAHAQETGFPFDAAAVKQVRALVEAAELPASMGALRRDITVGPLDARLRLAACPQVQTYWPAGARPWGRTRVGLRCTGGPKAWNVSVAVEVKVFGPAWVTAGALPAGHALALDDLKKAEIDLAADPSPAFVAAEAPPVGRTLSRPVQAGDGLRESHLKVREWFAAGEQVQIRAVGDGFAISGLGEAITPGVEGRAARVRAENGRIVSGKPVGERMLEIAL